MYRRVSMMESASTESNLTVTLSWFRDAIILSLKQYSQQIDTLTHNLSTLASRLDTKAEQKAIQYILQKIGSLDSSLQATHDRQELLGEKLRNVRLEDRFVRYAEGCEIQEKRHREIMQAETNITRCTNEIRGMLASKLSEKLGCVPRPGLVQHRIRAENMSLPPTARTDGRRKKEDSMNMTQQSQKVARMEGIEVVMVRERKASRGSNGNSPNPRRQRARGVRVQTLSLDLGTTTCNRTLGGDTNIVCLGARSVRKR